MVIGKTGAGKSTLCNFLLDGGVWDEADAAKQEGIEYKWRFA